VCHSNVSFDVLEEIAMILALELKLYMLQHVYHRLHESASPGLMAIHHSSGRFCDFLLFFSKTPRGSDP